MSPKAFHPKALDDFTSAKARESIAGDENQPTDGDWGRNDSIGIEGSEEDGQDDVIGEDRPPPDGENVEDGERNGIQIEEQTSPGTSRKKVTRLLRTKICRNIIQSFIRFIQLIWI